MPVRTVAIALFAGSADGGSRDVERSITCCGGIRAFRRRLAASDFVGFDDGIICIELG